MHWNAGEAAEYASLLRRIGHRVVAFSDPRGGEGLRAVRDDPPEAFVIGLDRLPSHGRAVAQWLRETKSTRGVPLVFVGGAADKVERVRSLLPDAAYTTWKRLDVDLARAMRDPPKSPARPGIFAGYAATPLPKKLGIKTGSRVVLLGAPAGFEKTLGPLPDGAAMRRQARGSADVVVCFAKTRNELDKRFGAAARILAAGGRIWIAWPKKAAQVASEISEKNARAFGLKRGFVDYKICAIDATWSGLCFARRGAR